MPATAIAHALTRRAPRLPSRSAGFSLVEMIAVLILIAIVASIVVTQVAPRLESGKVKAAQSQTKRISMAVEGFYLDTGRLPERLEELVSSSGNAVGWSGPYIQESNLKDPWNNAYQYRKPGADGRQFDIVSMGADGAAGGDGNNRDIGSWE